MTRNDTALICALFSSAFPNWVITAEGVELWHTFLADVPSEIAQQVAQEWVVTSEFAPTIAGIRKACAEKAGNLPPLALDAWSEVQTAIERDGRDFYIRGGRWSHPLIEDVVKSMGFGYLCMSTTIMADRAHFIKFYNEKRDDYISRTVTSKNFILGGERVALPSMFQLEPSAPALTEALDGAIVIDAVSQPSESR